ncbi:Rib/alpha-like domain-containing protein, partial [Streptococcus mitis]
KDGAPNTAVGQPGEVSGTVIVRYPDGTSEEVPVKVNVKGQADTYKPEPTVQTVDNGAVPEARNSIGNVDSLPPKTTFEWKDGAPNTAVGQPGEVSGTVIVRYPDGTSEEVPVKVNVKGQADTYKPEPTVQTVDNGAVPEARNSIGNVDSLPPKTTFEWKDGAPNTAVGQPG